MSDQLVADPSKAIAVAHDLVKILLDVDPETRRRAVQAALTLLGDAAPPANNNHTQPEGLAEFFQQEGNLKPADNAYFCAAYHFSVYGFLPFSLDDLRAIASEAGVIVPDRLDMTLKQAARGGKRLFQSLGRDSYRPTAAAGMLFNERWQIKPGKSAKVAAVE